MIYFDNAATSFVKPQIVKNAVTVALNKYTANPGRSGHNLSCAAAELVFDTREKLKEFFNASNHQVIFTKNCTEALNLAIFGILNAGDHVITTCYEHNSILRPLQFLKGRGVEVTTLFCDVEDLPAEIEKSIKPNTKMIITTACSNVTGECPDINAIGKIAKEHNLIYLVDGAQACGHFDIDLTKNNIDLFAFAGHKGLYATTGVGGLLVKENLKLKPLLFGGTGTESANLIQPTDMPEGLEAGTIPTIPIASLNAGVGYLTTNFETIKKQESELSNYLYRKLKNLEFVEPLFNKNSKNVFSFNLKDLDCMLVADLLNEHDICVRAGLHCAPLVHKKLGTLNRGAVRVSLDHFNTFEEVDKLIECLIDINKLKLKNQ